MSDSIRNLMGLLDTGTVERNLNPSFQAAADVTLSSRVRLRLDVGTVSSPITISTKTPGRFGTSSIASWLRVNPQSSLQSQRLLKKIVGGALFPQESCRNKSVSCRLLSITSICMHEFLLRTERLQPGSRR